MASANKPIDIYPFYCFYTLYQNLKGPSENKKAGLKHIFSLQDLHQRPPFNQHHQQPDVKRAPLFVTWLKLNKSGQAKKNKVKDHGENTLASNNEEEDLDYELRGCIGTFASLDLNEGLKDYALIAALEDTRFSPIQKKELPFLKCKVSILNEFKTIYDKVVADSIMHSIDIDRNKNNFWLHIDKNFHILPNDMQETNGIEVKFTYCSSRFSSTFLPEVMVENDFDLWDTFEHLVTKGLSRDYTDRGELKAITKTIMNDPEKYIDKVIVYKSHKTSLSFDEFEALMKDYEI